MTTLLISWRDTEDNQLLWRAAIRRGWSVVRVKGNRVPEIDDKEIVLYLDSLFGRDLADGLRLNLLNPPDDWLTTLPLEFTKRKIELQYLGDARRLAQPAFVKPPNDKCFEAMVYRTGSELPSEFESSMRVLVAEPVKWEVEFRCFALDGRVRTLSPYARQTEHARKTGYFATDTEKREATLFAESLLSTSENRLPRAIVIDVGIIRDRGWSVVEANGAWGSGIYGCPPDVVLDVVREATEPQN